MRVAMIGTGYVGLVSGACFADFGHVRSPASTRMQPRSRAWRQGEIPIFEPGLEQLVAANVREGRLSFSTDAAEAVREGGCGVHRRWARRPRAGATATRT